MKQQANDFLHKQKKMFSHNKIVQSEKILKGNVVSINDYNRCRKTHRPKTYSMKKALLWKRRTWALKNMTMGMSPGDQKGKPDSHTGVSKWKVEEISCGQHPTKNSAHDEVCQTMMEAAANDKISVHQRYDALDPSESGKLKASLGSMCSRVVGEKCFESPREFTNDSGYRTLKGRLNESIGNNDSTEFHHLSGKRYLLILRFPSRLHFRGALSITPIIGCTSFLGYEFSPSMQSHLVFSPKGTSPLYLQAVGYLNNADIENVANVPGVDKTILDRMGPKDSAILVESAYGEQWERLFGSFESTLNFNPLSSSAREKTSTHSELNVERALGVEFVQPGESLLSSRLHDENIEWNQLSESVLNAVIDEGPIRFMVFGGKGVGKSTFMRYMVNQWLSNCGKRKKSGLNSFNQRSVLFIDFDPGQSEFIPPGCISATLVTEPLLGPNYTHLRDPERMICIGDLNVERCPDWYIRCADELIKFCQADPALCQIPWFINTMGFCRGIGGELAVKLIQLCHPTHVIQIRSRFSRRNFEPIDILSRDSVNSWKGMDWNPSISSQKGTQVSEYFYYHLWSLAEKPSVEEEDILNRVQEDTGNGAKATPLQDSGELEDIDSEWGLPAWQSRDLCILAYFSQIMSGPRYSVLQSTPHKIKLSNLILSLPSPLLKPQMITTAFDARLVVLFNLNNSQKSTVMPENHKSGELSEGLDEVITERRKLPWEKVLRPNTLGHPKVLFHMPLAPCLGFGIVRAIDKISHDLFLTTPVKDEVLISVNCLATSPSIGSLPKEIYFEPLKLNPKRRDSIPYTVICDKKSTFSRPIPRVFQLPSKFLSINKV